MKYVVSSEEMPQNFPIYSIHSDMDSFILFNDDNDPPTDEKLLASELETCINEEPVSRAHEIAPIVKAASKQEKPPQTKILDLPNPKIT